MDVEKKKRTDMDVKKKKRTDMDVEKKESNLQPYLYPTTFTRGLTKTDLPEKYQ